MPITLSREHYAQPISDAVFTDQSPDLDHNFNLCNIDRTSFVRCDLSEATFESATLRDVLFVDCNLDRAIFCSSTLLHVSFVDCTMDKTDLSTIATHHLSFTRVRNFSPIFTAAALEGEVTFTDTDLSAATFFGAFAVPEVPLPKGYTKTSRGPNGLLQLNGIIDLKRVIYDEEYLRQFASPSAIQLILSEHPDLPVSHLVSLLSSLGAS